MSLRPPRRRAYKKMIGRLDNIRLRRESLLARSEEARRKIAHHFAECEAAMGPVDVVYRGLLFARSNPLLTAGMFALATRLLGGLFGGCFWRRKHKKSHGAEDPAMEQEQGKPMGMAKASLWIGRIFTGVQIARQVMGGLQRIR